MRTAYVLKGEKEKREKEGTCALAPDVHTFERVTFGFASVCASFITYLGFARDLFALRS